MEASDKSSDFFRNEDFIKGEKVNSLITKIILVKRLFVSDAIEAYNRLRLQNIKSSIYEIKARLINLFDDLMPYLKENLSLEEFEDLRNMIHNGGVTELLEAWDFINQFLYDKKLLDIFSAEVIL